MTVPPLPRTVTEAVLLIESQGLAPAVRGATFRQNWSKLFQAEGYYIDLSFVSSTSSGTLQGQVLGAEPLGGGDATLLREDGSTAAYAPLGPGGDFALKIQESRVYRLCVGVGGARLSVAGLPLS